MLDPVITAARSRYRRLIEQVQTLFTRHLEKASWPPPGRLMNAGVFDRFVAPRLGEKGYRVAYLMIDALRYELGVELEKLLTDIASGDSQGRSNFCLGGSSVIGKGSSSLG